MRTAVTQSSIQSYHDLRSEGFKGQYKAILDQMVPGQIYSRRQLASLAGLETSACSGRCNKLIELKQIEVCGHIECPITHRQVEGVKLVCQQQELLN